MHPQLAEVDEELRTALDRLHRLQANVPPERWNERPAPDRWSIAECIAHLNLTAEAFLPGLRAGIAEARELGGEVPRRFHRGFFGWLLWKILPPPARLKVKTTPRFVPNATAPVPVLTAEFERLHGEIVELLHQGEGLPLHRPRVPSPFSERTGYNLFAAFSIIPRHEHRHLWQAEQVWETLKSGPAGA